MARKDKGRNQDADSYDIGYRKPPRHSQFKKGQSGNPKGRPKDTRNVSTILAELMTEEVLIREDGRKRRVRADKLMLMRLRHRAVTGDHKALELTLRLLKEMENTRRPAADMDQLLDEDREILNDFDREVKTALPIAKPGEDEDE